MTAPADRDRVRSIVVDVVAEAVREAGARGVSLAADEGAEREILVSWLGEGTVGRLHVPDDETVAACAAAWCSPSEAQDVVRDVVRLALARMVARRDGLLVASGVTKTRLLLDPPVWADLHPLGDVWASTVRSWTGSARLPTLLESADDLSAVDRALQAWCEGRRVLEEALVEIPDGLRRRLEPVLRRPLPCGRPPLVPKLTVWTAGVDPPL